MIGRPTEGLTECGLTARRHICDFKYHLLSTHTLPPLNLPFYTSEARFYLHCYRLLICESPIAYFACHPSDRPNTPLPPGSGLH